MRIAAAIFARGGHYSCKLADEIIHVELIEIKGVFPWGKFSLDATQTASLSYYLCCWCNEMLVFRRMGCVVIQKARQAVFNLPNQYHSAKNEWHVQKPRIFPHLNILISLQGPELWRLHCCICWKGPAAHKKELDLMWLMVHSFVSCVASIFCFSVYSMHPAWQTGSE